VKILLTGFEPWGKQTVNPSGEIARELGGHVLPVDFDRAPAELRRLLREHRPHAVVMMGLAPGRKGIALEAIALNVEHHEGPVVRMIRKGGALALRSSLPLGKLYDALRKAGLPVSISHHAGTFVCNRVFYEGLATTTIPCGFVHVPPFKALSRARQLRAIRQILKTLGGSSPAATP
jgi:pyroglutamyl-peptidase